jgi:hypothetical protein
MADQPVAVGVGSLALTGEAPQRARKLDLTGQAPSAYQNTTIAVPAGSLTLTGYAPVAVGVVFPAVTSITLTGIIPAIENSGNTIRAPPTAILALTGQTPQRARRLTLTGYAPNPSDSADQQTVQPAAGSLNFAGSVPTRPKGLKLRGYAPQITEQLLSPSTKSVTLVGQAPTVSVGILGTIQPITAARILTGHSPAIEIFIANADASLELTGYIPTFRFDSVVGTAPGIGSITLATYIPTVGTSDIPAAVPTGTLNLAGQIPSIGRPLPGTGSLTLAGYVPTKRFGSFTVRSPATKVGILTGQAPTVKLGPLQEPGINTLNLTGQIPAVTYDWVVDVPAGTVNVQGFESFLGTFGGTIGVKEIALLPHMPIILYEMPEAFPEAATLSLTNYGLIVGPVENPDKGTLALSGKAPSLVFSQNWFITIDLGRLEFTASSPNIIGWFLEGPITDIWSKDSAGSTTWTKDTETGDDEWQS